MVSNEAFEALIDLLATDGIDHTPAHPQANVTLRDSSGKLDFDKIRTMFAVQNDGHEDGDSDDEPHSHQGTSSTAPSRAQSMSPNPVERPSPGHRRSSTFGNQPWAAMHLDAVAKVEDVPHNPLSFDELNAALAGAHEEVRSLRRKYDELRALISKPDQPKPCPFVPKVANGHTEISSPSDVPSEIARLSEDEAKRALGVLARSLNLSLDALANLSIPPTSPSTQQHLSIASPARQHDIASVIRAIKFLGTVDELVWRRTLAPSGPRTLLPVFSEENSVALVARLELWERAVRRSSRV